MRLFSVCFVFAVGVCLTASGPVVRAGGEKVGVLFDFGDGSYAWANVELGHNKTAINVTLAGAGSLGFHVSYSWSSAGVFVQDIGDRGARYPQWWHLFIWNMSGSSWEFSSLGAFALNLTDGDSIAWYLAVDNPNGFISPVPSPTPSNPYPRLLYRNDIRNSGEQGGLLCGDHRLAWEYNTSAFEISGTPAAANGMLFVPTWEGLLALNEETGSFVWKRADISGMSSPAFYDGGLFIGAKDGRLHRVFASSGTEDWNTTLISHPSFTGIASSPTPYKDKVFVGLFNESGGKGGIVALNIWNGTILWKHEAPSVHMSSPAVAGDTLYVGVMGYYNGSSAPPSFDPPHGLLALNASDGSRRWFMQVGGAVASSPLIVGSSIFFTSRDGVLHAVALDGTALWAAAISPSTSSPATDGDRIFVADGLLNGMGHVTAFDKTGRQLWRTTLIGPVQSSPLYVDGVILITTNEKTGTIYTLDAKNGTLLWSYLPEPQDFILSSPIVADGRTFMASDNGIVYAFGCTPSPTEHEVSYAWLVAIPLLIAATLAIIAYVIGGHKK